LITNKNSKCGSWPMSRSERNKGLPMTRPARSHPGPIALHRSFNALTVHRPDVDRRSGVPDTSPRNGRSRTAVDWSANAIPVGCEFVPGSWKLPGGQGMQAAARLDLESRSQVVMCLS
jgi:hypothetical protein